MYCPNCGTSQSEERPTRCESCELPLGPVNELLAANHDAIERKERMAREKRDRLIGAGLFVAIAAAPLALGIKNGLAAQTPALGTGGQGELGSGAGRPQLGAGDPGTAPARTV